MKWNKLAAAVLSVFLGLVLAGCLRTAEPQYTLILTSPSDENEPMPQGRHFYVSGTIETQGGSGVPEDAQMLVRLLDETGEAVRTVRSVGKGTSCLWAFHESYVYDVPEDPERADCVAGYDPVLVVEDITRPMESFANAEIKCAFSDDQFRALIVCATDAAHGLLQDDGVGFVNGDGTAIEGLPAGDYSVQVTLLDGRERVLASAEKELTIGNPTDSVIGRFHPQEHYERLLDWYSQQGWAINIDWIPGFMPTSNGVVSGFPAMFANNDLAVYSVSKAHMLMYLIEPSSSSNRLELAYLQYAGRVGSPETFAAYHYDIGEPVVYLPDGEVLEGTIVPFAEQDYLDLCRVDEVTDEAVDNIYPFEGNYNVKSNTRLDGTVVVDASRKFAVSGALAPFQVEPEDVSQTEGGLYELRNKFDTVTYTFDDGTSSRTYRKSAVMTRYNYAMRANAYVCYYEFYNVFDGAEVLEPGKTYTVTVQGYDNHGTPVEGAQETMTIRAE